MNSIVVILVLLTGLCYFGGSYCPPSLKKYKEMILGILVGYVLNLMLNSNVDGWQGGEENGLRNFCNRILNKINKNERFSHHEYAEITRDIGKMDVTDNCNFNGEIVTGRGNMITYLLQNHLNP